MSLRLPKYSLQNFCIFQKFSLHKITMYLAISIAATFLYLSLNTNSVCKIPMIFEFVSPTDFQMQSFLSILKSRNIFEHILLSSDSVTNSATPKPCLASCNWSQSRNIDPYIQFLVIFNFFYSLLSVP